MYKQTKQVIINNVPKNEPIDLYVMKRGASLLVAAVTANTYQATYVDTEAGIRDVDDFTRLCTEHEFTLTKDSVTARQYNLTFTLDVRDSLCSVDEHPCVLATLPDQLIEHLAG